MSARFYVSRTVVYVSRDAASGEKINMFRKGILIAILMFGASDLRAAAPSFQRDVAPILAARCISCQEKAEKRD